MPKDRPAVTAPMIEETWGHPLPDPLLDSWVRHLRAENKSEATITAYWYAVEGLHTFMAVEMHLNIPSARSPASTSRPISPTSSERAPQRRHTSAAGGSSSSSSGWWRRARSPSPRCAT